MPAYPPFLPACPEAPKTLPHIPDHHSPQPSPQPRLPPTLQETTLSPDAPDHLQVKGSQTAASGHHRQVSHTLPTSQKSALPQWPHLMPTSHNVQPWDNPHRAGRRPTSAPCLLHPLTPPPTSSSWPSRGCQRLTSKNPPAVPTTLDLGSVSPPDQVTNSFHDLISTNGNPRN